MHQKNQVYSQFQTDENRKKMKLQAHQDENTITGNSSVSGQNGYLKNPISYGSTNEYFAATQQSLQDTQKLNLHQAKNNHMMIKDLQ